MLAGVEDECDRAALLLVDDADPGHVADVRVRALVPPKIPGGVEDARPRPAPAPPVVGLQQVALGEVLVGVEACVGRRCSRARRPRPLPVDIRRGSKLAKSPVA